MSETAHVMEARLRAPFVSARTTLTSVPLRVIQVEDDAGRIGFGEAPDAARLDLEGRASGRPVWRVLGASTPTEVEVNATVAAADPAAAGREAAGAGAAGFGAVKVKVGRGDEVARIEAVREAAGAELAIRLDANGAWSPTQAIQALNELERFEIECCEEPCSGLEEIERVAGEVPMPVSIDESSALPGALERRVCTAVCLKLARCGGVRELIEAARRARSAGYEVYLASMLEGPLGIAAALHAAAVIRPDRPSGLATLPLFADRQDPIPAHDGSMVPPRGPGLGNGLLEWYGIG